MPKRFTGPEKWDDPWFWELSPQAKLLWFFLCDHCDNAGIIEVSFKLASSKIGLPVNEKHLSELESRLHTLPCGKRIIIDFIRFQYGTVSRDCKPHNPVFASLGKHGIDLPYVERLSKGLAKATQTLMEGLGNPTIQEKEKETDKEKDNEGGIQRGKPTLAAVRLCMVKVGLPESDADWFWNKCEGNGWTNGGKKIKSWPHVIASWKAAGYMPSQKGQVSLPKNNVDHKELKEHISIKEI